MPNFSYTVEIEREDDGRWIAEIPELPGVMVYGNSKDEVTSRVEALALRVVADQIEERGQPAGDIHFATA